MTDTPEQSSASPGRVRSTRWFVPGLLVAGITLYWFTRGSSEPAEGWGNDFQAAVVQATATQQNVLVFFFSPG